MKCPNCGRYIADDSNFCEFCGKKLNKSVGRNKNRSRLWIGVCAVLILIAGAILWGVVSTSQDSYNYEEPYYQNEIVETTEEVVEEYAYSQSEEIYCDGIYDPDEAGHGLDIRVSSLNMNHFLIKFSFNPVSYKGKLSWTDAQYPLIIGQGSRALGICLKSDGKIYITTNNHSNIFATDISYVVGGYNNIVLEYHDGEVTINGAKLQVGYINLFENDLVFTTKCYSTGNAFKGYIKDLSIINLYKKNDM